MVKSWGGFRGAHVSRAVILLTSALLSVNGRSQQTAAIATERPALRANGTSWLITIVPAVVPRQYAIQRAQKVCMRTITDA